MPISIFSGLLGVGPGFLLLPAMILLGMEPKRAAAMTAVAVTPPSFSALLPHLPAARFDARLTLVLVLAGAVGAFLGARLTSRVVRGARVKQLFGLLIVLMTACKIYTLLR